MGMGLQTLEELHGPGLDERVPRSRWHCSAMRKPAFLPDTDVLGAARMTPDDKLWVNKHLDAEKEDSMLDFESDEDETSEKGESAAMYQELAAVYTEAWRFLLLGKRGAGKSSAGNTILGWTAFSSDMTLGRVTAACERKAGVVEGKGVAVIDTPGLKGKKDREMVREILKSVSLYRPGPHVFLMVLPVGNLTRDDIHINKLVEKMFGKKVWNYTIVLFTHGDRLEGAALNDIISSADVELREFIRKCSGGYVVFNNKDMRDRSQVTRLLAKIETLVAINGNGCYTTALYPRTERKVREKQEKILEENKEEIMGKEKEIDSLYRGEELEKKKLEFWRSVDEDTRKQAEMRKVKIIKSKKHD